MILRWFGHPIVQINKINPYNGGTYSNRAGRNVTVKPGYMMQKYL